MPACGPPSSLSPEKATRSAPASTWPRIVGSASHTGHVQRSEQAASRVDEERDAPRLAQPRPAPPPCASSVKPTSAKFDRCTFATSAVAGESARS